MWKILIVDDHPIVIDGLRSQIDTQSDLMIVGQTGDGIEVEALVNHLQPDVLLLDLALPGLSGLEVTRRVKDQTPHTHIVILSMYDNIAYVAEAFRCGAQAYVLKKSVSVELIKAIRAVLAGQRYISPPLSEMDIDEYALGLQTDDLDVYRTLTRREVEVLHLIVDGLTCPRIAKRLGVGTRTIETHRANIMKKTSIHTTAELVTFALSKGIQPPAMPPL